MTEMAIPKEIRDEQTHSSFQGSSLQQSVSSQIGPTSSNVIPTMPGPELPPILQEARKSTVDSVLAEMEKMPFFMKSLPPDASENPELEALKALAYEGEPHEVAQNFKDQGNDCFKTKQFREAVEFYTKALAVKSGITNIDEACYVNRAAANLELENYRKVLNDCAEALKLNRMNVKAFYRSGIALERLGRMGNEEGFSESLDCILRGLSIEPANKALLLLKQSVEEEIRKRNEKKRKKKEEEERLLTVKYAVNIALSNRGIKTRLTQNPPGDLPNDTRVKLENELDPQSTLFFPTIFVYPLENMTDFITAFQEDCTLADQLGVVLSTEAPPEWDKRGEYVPTNVDCYMETITGGLIKVGKKVKIGEVLGGGKIEILDGILRIIIIPRNKSEGWIKDYKEKKGSGQYGV